jgi:hypothetical protein
VLFYFAREAAGAAGARHSLRLLIQRAGLFPAKLARKARRDRGAVATAVLKIESGVIGTIMSQTVIVRESGRSSIPERL